MLIVVHGESIMLISIHGVKLYAHCYTRSDAMWSLQYME